MSFLNEVLSPRLLNQCFNRNSDEVKAKVHICIRANSSSGVMLLALAHLAIPPLLSTCHSCNQSPNLLLYSGTRLHSVSVSSRGHMNSLPTASLPAFYSRYALTFYLLFIPGLVHSCSHFVTLIFILLILTRIGFLTPEQQYVMLLFCLCFQTLAILLFIITLLATLCSSLTWCLLLHYCAFVLLQCE